MLIYENQLLQNFCRGFWDGVRGAYIRYPPLPGTIPTASTCNLVENLLFNLFVSLSSFKTAIVFILNTNAKASLHSFRTYCTFLNGSVTQYFLVQLLKKIFIWDWLERKSTSYLQNFNCQVMICVWMYLFHWELLKSCFSTLNLWCTAPPQLLRLWYIHFQTTL